MDSQTGTASVLKHRRKSHVFVEIPRSPLFKRVASTLEKANGLSASLLHKNFKENSVPLLTKPVVVIEKKRKPIDDYEGMLLPEAKKLKSANGDEGVKACHQCRSKKPLQVMLQCTHISQKTGVRCKASYCDTCLRNRYGEDIDILRQTKPASPQHDEIRKVTNYTFNCPRCEGHCNCAPCRKKQGLPPVGKFNYVAGQASVREILKENPQASGLLRKATINTTDKPVTTTSELNVLEKVNAEQVKTKQQLTKTGSLRVTKHPEPVWVAIRDAGSKDDIEDRITLREFVLRFNPILNIGVRNLDELEDFTTLHDASAKAVLVSLLDLIALEDTSHKKTIQAAVKMIRSLGVNWGKIVPVLYDLGEGLPHEHLLHDLPALKESDVETFYNTRGTRFQGLRVDQILPILLYLIDIILQGATVRQELEEGSKQFREARMAYSKAMKEETDKWAIQKVDLLEERPKGDTETLKGKPNPWRIKYLQAEKAHKEAVVNLRHLLKAEMDACSSRFMPLGCDIDGRTYYILSASGPHQGKKDRVPSEAERSGMRKWSWFIAVYGRPGTIIAETNPDDVETDSGDGDPNANRWWGFVNVEDMRKLSKWLAQRGETEPPASPSHSLTTLSEQEADERMGTLSGMKYLARSIMEFADFVEWRLKNGAQN